MGTYFRLIDVDSSEEKREFYLGRKNVYVSGGTSYNKIPGKQIAYWVSEALVDVFDMEEKIADFAISDGQTKTGNNDKYLRMLWEVSSDKVGPGKKWVIHAKGGGFRRWSGNIDVVIDWSDEAREHYRRDHVARIAPEYIWYKQGICWTLISGSKKYGFRLLEEGTTFNLAAPAIFIEDERKMYYVMGYLNTSVAEEIIHLVNPTINTNISDIIIQPYKEVRKHEMDEIVGLVKENVNISSADWCDFETAWEFKKHPLL